MATDLRDLQAYEQAVIGSTMLDWELAQKLKSSLSPEEIADGQCRSCWSLFCRSTNRDEYIETLGKVGQVAFVSACMDSELPLSILPWAATRIKAAAQKRRMQLAIGEIWKSNEDVLAQLDVLVAEEKKRLEAGADDDLPARLHAATVQEIRSNDLSQRLSIGIPSLDRIVQGLRPGNISVLGAEPSTGKTAMALNIAVANLRRKKRVLIFSLEMSAVQMMDRMISNAASIPYSRINNKALDDKELELFEITSYSLTVDNILYIYDTVYTVEQMGAIIANVKPDLVIVDFLQFCRTTEKTQNTADRLEYIVSEFKRLAKVEHHTCHILLLSQPSRQATKEGQSMFALKGSSGIEQGGDVILLLDRPAVRDFAYQPEQAQVKVAKNKFGSTGVADLWFEGEYQRFRDLQEGEVFMKREPMEEKPW